jgi:hypothetical protein
MHMLGDFRRRAQRRRKSRLSCWPATVSLQQQMEDKIDAKTASLIAMRYADKRCKGRISEGASDYVYHSIHGMAKEWFGEDK